MVPDEAYSDVFSGVLEGCEIDGDEFATVIGALLESNFNLVHASAALYMHKNTLVYKLNKIKRALQIDPVNSRADRDLCRYLNYYLRSVARRNRGDDERS